jgi:hypothetical protein
MKICCIDVLVQSHHTRSALPEYLVTLLDQIVFRVRGFACLESPPQSVGDVTKKSFFFILKFNYNVQ